MFPPQKDFFKTFIRSYVVVLLLPLVTGLYIQFMTLGVIERDAQTTNLAILEQGRDIVSSTLEEIDNVLSTLPFDRKVLTFLNMSRLTEGSPELGKINDASERLNSYIVTSKLIKDIVVISRPSGFIISKTISVSFEGLFYGNLFNMEGTDEGRWEREILDRLHLREFLPAVNVNLVNKRFRAIACLQTLPMSFPRPELGMTMILIDADAIGAMLSRVPLGPGGSAFIMNRQGQVIMSVGAPTRNAADFVSLIGKKSGCLRERIGGRDLLITHTGSDDNGWTYVAAVPYSFVMSKVNSIRWAILAVFLLTLIAGAIILVVVSARNAKPLTSMLEDNELMARKLEDQAPLVRFGFFRRLFEGSFGTREELSTLVGHLGLKKDASRLTVVMIMYADDPADRNALEKMDTTRVILRESILARVQDDHYLYDVDDTILAVIFAFADGDEGECSRALSQAIGDLSGSLERDFHISVSIGVGGFAQGWFDLHNSYAEASRALEGARFSSSGRIGWYSDIVEATDRIFYPFETESRLVNLMKLGKKEDALTLLGRIMEENFEKRKVFGAKAQALYELLFATCERFMEQYGGSDTDIRRIVDMSRHSSCFEGMIDCVRNGIVACCDRFAETKAVEENALKDRIIAFIAESYARPDLCLASVSSRFNYSESYLYDFFMSRVRMSFSTFLEVTRIGKAREFLEDPGIPIDEVAALSGYASAHSFRRAFKRNVGMLPSEYREISATVGKGSRAV
jgi:two-component system, response regulator YesN